MDTTEENRKGELKFLELKIKELESQPAVTEYLELRQRKDGLVCSPVPICCICGESVAPGSGKFVNRVPDCNDLRTRIDNGHRFPLGDFVCAECDSEDPEEAIEQGGNVYDVDLCSFHVQADSEEEAREKAIRYIVSEYTPVIDAIYICESDCPVRSC